VTPTKWVRIWNERLPEVPLTLTAVSAAEASGVLRSKDLTYRPVSDAPESRVALSWPQEKTTELVEQFIGIVRGRTVNSTRGRPPTPAQPKRKRPATGDARRTPAAGSATQPSAARQGGLLANG
jgi:hypothetical protein